MASRAVPTWLLVALTLSAGLGAGALLGRHWRAEVLRREWRQLERRWGEAARRRRDPEQWRRDSARQAEWEAQARRRPRPLHPREVRRAQVFAHCAVSFEIRDSTWGALTLFNARAWARARPGLVVAEGWSYDESGYEAGDTVTVVLPNVYCSEITIGGFGAALAAPEPPVRLRVR